MGKIDKHSEFGRKAGDVSDLPKYGEVSEGGRHFVQNLQDDPNADPDIERAAKEFGVARGWSKTKISEFTAKWKSGFFMELTGFDVKFPTGLSISGAIEFVNISKKNQWVSRVYNRRGGVDGFLEQIFEDVLKNNKIPVTLIKYTDEELYERIVRAHAAEHPLPAAIVYDVIGGEQRRPRVKSNIHASVCGMP